MTTLPPGVTFQYDKKLVKPGEIENLVTTTETPGGYRECTFNACSGVRPVRTEIIRIHDSNYNKYPFIGRISSVHKQGLTYNVTATRSTRDKTYTVNTVPADATHPSGFASERIYRAGTLLQTALTDALSITPDVSSGHIVTLADQFTADSNDLGGQTAEQVWDYISSILASLDTPLLWHVRGLNGIQVVDIDYQDLAPRYFVHLLEDQIEETYDDTAICNQCAVAFGHGQIAIWPPIIDYSVIKTTHTKYINASNTITRYPDALALAQTIVARMGKDRTVSDVLTIQCEANKVRVVPPVYNVAVDDWPLWLMESGHGIELLNRPIGNIQEKYITGTEFNWDDGKLTARCGEVRSQESQVTQIVDYNVNRLFNGPYNGPAGLNQPLADADLLPKVGSEVDSASPPNTSYGVPGFKAAADGDTQNKYGKAIDPDIIADEGIEINYTFETVTTGWKGGTWSIPGELRQVKFSLWKGTATNGLQIDTVTFDIYTRKATENPVFLQKIEIVGVAEGIVTISPYKSLPGRNVQLVFNVTVPSTDAEIINVTLHGKKQFPSLKL